MFAGGEVFLAGDWYRDSTRAYALTADTFALGVRRVDDSTIAATLPSSENGSMQLTENIDGADVDRGALEVHGFARAATIQARVEVPFTLSRNPALPYAITGDSIGVSVIDLRSDLVIRYPGVGRLRYEGSGCTRIAGPTYLDGTFIIWDTATGFPSQKATRWQLFPDTVRKAALPPSGAACGIAEVSPQVFVRTGSEGTEAFVFIDSVDAGGNSTYFYSDTAITNEGFYWDPAGSHMVLGAFNPHGAGVIDLENRDLAYRVPAVTDVRSAAFTVDRQVILLCGRGQQNQVLVSVDAASGDSLQGIPLACQSLAIDPQLGLLYALVYGTNPSVFVAVLDPTTLTQVGKMDVPITTCFYCSFSALFIDRANSELILLSTNGPDEVRLAHLSLPSAFSIAPTSSSPQPR